MHQGQIASKIKREVFMTDEHHSQFAGSPGSQAHSAQPEMADRMKSMVYDTQDRICEALAALDGSPFREDVWERPDGGGGRSRVLQNGQVFEKAGVNVSIVHGVLTPQAAASMGGGKNLSSEQDLQFFATGISLVIHPHNPMAPTAHANYRYFERGGGQKKGSWWFGGGADLTPAYLFEEDVAHFHRTHQEACNRHDPSFYPLFKKWCDDYFFIKHRNETRGVGGIFFDDLHDRHPDRLFAFAKDCASSFAPAYLPLVEKHQNDVFTPAQKEWQQIRRGRYVEFNLVYDRGTTFGLQSGGRVESILMSLPVMARWEYDHHPQAESAEDKLLQVLRQPCDWV
jgi:coproporphyrinogen III oxidase